MNRTILFAVQLCGFLFCAAALRAAEPSRTYIYQSFDTNGILVVQGFVTLRMEEASKVKGDWRLHVLDKDRITKLGSLEGSGKIAGTLKSGTVFLNLHPDMYENNIFLEGKVSGANMSRIDGTWGYYGFVGRVNQGKFEMAKKDDPQK